MRLLKLINLETLYSQILIEKNKTSMLHVFSKSSHHRHYNKSNYSILYMNISICLHELVQDDVAVDMTIQKKKKLTFSYDGDHVETLKEYQGSVQEGPLTDQTFLFYLEDHHLLQGMMTHPVPSSFSWQPLAEQQQKVQEV